MNEDKLLRAIVAEHGVFLRREAEAIGYDDRTIQSRRRTGRWVRVRHGAYTFPEQWREADELERYRLRGRAVHRTHDPRGLLTHTSSVVMQEIEVWGADLSMTHVTRVDGSLGRTGTDVRYHRGLVAEEDRAEVHGVPVTCPARAVVEHALISNVESGLVVANSALNRGLVTAEGLAAMHARMAHWHGALQTDLVLRLADRRIESVGESRAFYLMWSQGLPIPHLQFEVRDAAGELVGRSDFAWPKHGLLGEFDGKIKYGRLLEPGEEAGDVVFREKKREELMCRITGWRMVRMTWADLYRPEATAAYIRGMMRRAA